jgi:hypothetical protein
LSQGQKSLVKKPMPAIDVMELRSGIIDEKNNNSPRGD